MQNLFSKVTTIAATLAILGASNAAFATVENAKTVTRVAAELSKGYFRVAEPLSVACQYDVIFMDLTAPSGRAQLGVLLAIKAMNKKISTLAYSQDASGACWLSTVEME